PFPVPVLSRTNGVFPRDSDSRSTPLALKNLRMRLLMVREFPPVPGSVASRTIPMLDAAATPRLARVGVLSFGNPCGLGSSPPMSNRLEQADGPTIICVPFQELHPDSVVAFAAP